MSTLPDLPDAIHLNESAARLSIQLPRRRPARQLVRKVVIPKLALGLGLLVGAVVVIQVGHGTGALVVAGILGAISLILVGMALSFLATRSEAAVVGQDLILTEWIGPVPVRRTRACDRLRRIATHHALEGDGADPPPNGVLEITSQGAPPLWFGVGYPRAWLLAVGARLAKRCAVPHEEVPFDSPAVKIAPFFLGQSPETDTSDQPVQPTTSRIVVERGSDGLTVLRVPPTGLGRGWRSLAQHIDAVFATAFLAYLWFGKRSGASAVVGLLLVGVVALRKYSLMRRHTVLAASPEGLDILSTGGFRYSQRDSYERAEIRELHVGFGDIGQGGLSRHALWLHLLDGRLITLLGGRDREELRWVATELRKALDVPAVAQEVLTQEEVASGAW